MIIESMPMVTVGIPTYNHGKFLKEALRSLLSQTYKNIEIIISNNASTDGTAVICKRFVKKKDILMRYYEQKKNIGARNNFNFVFSKARGKYFMWAASDDFFHKNYIINLVAELEKNPSASIGVSNIIYFRENHKTYHKLKFQPYEKSLRSLKIFLLHPNYNAIFYGIYRTSILKKTFLKSKLLTNPFHFSYADDTRFLFRVLLSGDLVHINKYYFSKRDGTYMSKMKTDFVQKKISQTTITIIIQNALLILSDICNFFYFQYYIYKSDNQVLQKLSLTFYSIISLMINILNFFKNTFRCVIWLIMGFFKPFRLRSMGNSLLKP